MAGIRSEREEWTSTSSQLNCVGFGFAPLLF